MAGMKGRSGGPRRNSGGYRPGSGPKKKPPETVAVVAADEEEFLRKLMTDDALDVRVRLDAAKTLFNGRLKVSGGIKGHRSQMAEAAANGRFSGAEAPRLVRDNTKAA